MLTKRAPDVDQTLSLYSRILRGQLVPNDEHSQIQSHLKLTGIVLARNRALAVRNDIYRTVFDAAWIREHLPINWPQRLRRALTVSAAIFLFLCLPLAIYALNRAVVADRERQRAMDESQRARSAEADARRERLRAEKLAAAEREQRQTAETERRVAESEREEARRAQAREAAARRDVETKRSQLAAYAKQEHEARVELERARERAFQAEARLADVREQQRAQQEAALRLDTLVTGASPVDDLAVALIEMLTDQKGQFVAITPAQRRSALTAIARISEATKGSWRGAIRSLSAHRDSIKQLIVVPSGLLVLTVGNDDQVCAWSSHGFARVWCRDIDDRVRFASMTQGSDHVVLFLEGGNVTTLDLIDGKQAQSPPGSSRTLASFAFSRFAPRFVTDQHILASGRSSPTPTLWPTTAALPIASIERCRGRTTALSTSNTERLLAWGCDDGAIGLMNTGEPMQTPRYQSAPVHDTRITSLHIHETGERVLLLSSDRGGTSKITILGETHGAAPVTWTRFPKHVGSVKSDVSPNGNYAATAGDDGVANLCFLWSSEDLVLDPFCIKLRSFEEFLSHVAFTKDGSHLLVASRSGTLYAYPATLKEFARTTCRILQWNPAHAMRVAERCRSFTHSEFAEPHP